MAAPLIIFQRRFVSSRNSLKSIFNSCAGPSRPGCPDVLHYRLFTNGSGSFKNFNYKSGFRVAFLLLGGSYAARQIFKTVKESESLKVHADDGIDKGKAALKIFTEDKPRPAIAPSRQVRVDTDHSGLKLTLYQYQTCPFCCKVRAVLDYHGFSYDVIEVNSVTKKQLKWSEYKKVPTLVAQLPGSSEDVVLRDSSVIISVLESYLADRTSSLAKLNTYFPCLTEGSGRKMKYDFQNRYFVMYQDIETLDTTAKQRNEERKWRKWADSHMVHMLSPNVYRTPSEALESFRWFSDVGNWEKNFTYMERMIVIYLGGSIMYILGKVLKRRYSLKEDVRESLYDACNEWVKAIGKNRQFMGGNKPNLADLAVFGVLNSIEGCGAFQDALNNSKIGPWYDRTKEMVSTHQGTHPLNAKSFPSETPKKPQKV